MVLWSATFNAVLVVCLVSLTFTQIVLGHTFMNHYTISQIPILNVCCTQVRNIWFFSPLVPSKREKNIQTVTTQFVSVCIIFEGRAIYVYFYKILYFTKTKYSALNPPKKTVFKECAKLALDLSYSATILRFTSVLLQI